MSTLASAPEPYAAGWPLHSLLREETFGACTNGRRELFGGFRVRAQLDDARRCDADPVGDGVNERRDPSKNLIGTSPSARVLTEVAHRDLIDVVSAVYVLRHSELSCR